MNAAALLAELKDAGVQIVRDGDKLRLRGKPGTGLALYAEQVREFKPQLLAILSSTEPKISAVVWFTVSHEEVDASKPPGDWDGTLPASCAWRSLCQTLGPCSRHLVGDPCRLDAQRPYSGEAM